MEDGNFFNNSRRILKYHLLRLFRSHDSPSYVAGGFANGVILRFFPTFGFSLAFAYFLAKITRTSALACSISCALTTPIFPFFYYLNFLTGHLIFEQSLDFDWDSSFEIAKLGKYFFSGAVINSILCFFLIWFFGTIILKNYKKPIIKKLQKL